MELDSYYANDGTELHRGCDGDILFFKEGWICDKCKENGEWVVQTAVTETTESAPNVTQERPQDAQVIVSTGVPSGSGSQPKSVTLTEFTRAMNRIIDVMNENFDRLIANGKATE